MTCTYYNINVTDLIIKSYVYQCSLFCHLITKASQRTLKYTFGSVICLHASSSDDVPLKAWHQHSSCVVLHPNYEWAQKWLCALESMTSVRRVCCTLPELRVSSAVMECPWDLTSVSRVCCTLPELRVSAEASDRRNRCFY